MKERFEATCMMFFVPALAAIIGSFGNGEFTVNGSEYPVWIWYFICGFAIEWSAIGIAAYIYFMIKGEKA